MKNTSYSHSYVLNKDIIQIKQRNKMKNITNISYTTCQSSDAGVEFGVANSNDLYTSVLVPINECVVLNSEQKKSELNLCISQLFF